LGRSPELHAAHAPVVREHVDRAAELEHERVGEVTVAGEHDLRAFHAAALVEPCPQDLPAPAIVPQLLEEEMALTAMSEQEGIGPVPVGGWEDRSETGRVRPGTVGPARSDGDEPLVASEQSARTGASEPHTEPGEERRDPARAVPSAAIRRF